MWWCEKQNDHTFKECISVTEFGTTSIGYNWSQSIVQVLSQGSICFVLFLIYVDDHFIVLPVYQNADCKDLLKSSW